ncbi:MAG: hypothetical protein OXD30_13160, partial [Bryobacterales bacterium]|nr:hypothetical protein [Bryobacterales bacterium]
MADSVRNHRVDDIPAAAANANHLDANGGFRRTIEGGLRSFIACLPGSFGRFDRDRHWFLIVIHHAFSP